MDTICKTGKLNLRLKKMLLSNFNNLRKADSKFNIKYAEYTL